MMASANASKVAKCCVICRKNESLGSTTFTGGIEVPCDFLDSLNIVWPSLEESVGEGKTRMQNGGAEIEDKNCSEDGGGRFTEVPPICQVCADRIQSVQYFKGLSERYLEKLRKSMEEAKEANGPGPGPSFLFSSNSKDGEIPKKSVETQQKPDIPVPTLYLPWKPKFLQNVIPSPSPSSQDQSVSMETQQIERTTCGILNKLTNNGSNFDILAAQFVGTLPFLKREQDSHRDTQLIMNTIASLIFNKAVKEPFYCPAYARLIHVISKLSSKFRKSILDLCQSQFLQVFLNTEESYSAEETENEDRRQRCFGIVNFIQELYNFKFQLITPKILVTCLEVLLHPPANQLKMECVYNFLSAEKHDEKIPFGQIIDVQLNALRDAVQAGEKVKYLPEDACMDKIFEQLSEISKNPKLSGRIRCLLENLVELRGNEWRKKEKICKIAKTTTEVPCGKTGLNPMPPSEEPALTLWHFERKTRGILNKLNLKNGQLFSRNFSRFLKLPFWFCGQYSNNDVQILKAGEMIFEKAVKEPMFCNSYAEMVKKISQFRKKFPYSINFEKIREIVVNRCIEEISKINDGDKGEGVLAQEKFVERERILGVIKFIEELIKMEVFSARNMANCMQFLVNGEVNEVKMECVCKLLMCKFMNRETKEMVYYGEFLDVQLSVFGAVGMGDDEDVRWIEEMFGSMKKFVEDVRFVGRMRCLLMNLIELRGNGWKHESKAVASIAVGKNEDGGKKNGGKKKVRKAGIVPDGNWRN